MPGSWKWLTPLYVNELAKASGFHSSGIDSIDPMTAAFPFSSSNSLRGILTLFEFFFLMNSHEIHSSMNNILHFGPEFLENSHDVGPYDLGLLVHISLRAFNELASGWISCPLSRYEGERCVGRDD
jgi:hypothetical protein